jgi:beta-1,4-N-acetylglucosaminyltransferase
MSYRVGLVCSTGGHLAQLHWLQRWWAQHDRFWVSFDKPDAVHLLADERVYYAQPPPVRDPINLAKNTRLAIRILRRERPDVVVSNGAGIAFPFCVVAKAMGIPVVFIEVYDRIDSPTVTGLLLSPIVDAVVLQWEEQRNFYPHGVYLGPTR